MAEAGRPKIVLGVDFEDWQQLVCQHIGIAGWDRAHACFERQAQALLDLLDELGVSATFFLLGMTAKNYPGLVEAIAEHGHEPASHGYTHKRVPTQTAAEFRDDLRRSIDLIGSLAGRRPLGYRAPAFSIDRRTPWAWEALADLGFLYDASQYDTPRLRERVEGIPDRPYWLELPSGGRLLEFPISVFRVRGRPIPVGGGTYWRVLPLSVILHALRTRAAADALSVLYFHPYEFDPLPLRAELPPAPSVGQRGRALYRFLRANPGRQRIPPRIRSVAREFRLISHEHACKELVEHETTRSRALSEEGVLV
jgi:polysaccharide deacetylase family protein (PEP-CTERM system associated)